MIKKITVHISLLTLVISVQAAAQLLMSAGTAYHHPTAQLGEWFDSGSSFSFNIGTRRSDNWDLSFNPAYSNFSNTHRVNSSEIQNIPLELSVTRFWVRGSYAILGNNNSISPRIILSGGPLHWKGTRGEILADESIGLPAIPEKVLQEWNMGFMAGLGLTIAPGGPVEFETNLNYQLIPGSLWPTMQEYVELESVNSFQSLVFELRLTYLF